MAVALAVLIAGSTVEPSALTVAAAGQKQAAVTTVSDEPDAAMTKTAVGSATVSGNSGTVADKASGGQYGIATLSGESGSADDVVSLTVGVTTTYYTCLSEAVAALPKGSDATLTLLNDCPVDMKDWTIGSNQSDTITLDLAGHALVLPEGYSVVLKSNTFIVMSSKDGGELRCGVFVYRGKTATFKENVKITGMVNMNQRDATVCVEGASIAKLNFSEGSCRVSSGSVEEIEWSNVGLAITGGTIGKLNCESYLKRSSAFPAGYEVKNPDTGIRYTRAELDAEGFSGKIEAYSCKEHVYEKGYCKYCNALIADCKHADLDQTTGVCRNCGLQVLAAVRSEEGNVYCTSWETLCSETEKLVDGKEYTVYFYTDVTATGEQCAKLQNGTVTLDLGGHNIKNGMLETLFKIAGGAVTIENGTLTGCDKSKVLDVTGGSLRLEKNLKILWEKTLYGFNLATSGGETTIDRTSMESVMYVAGGTITILDGSFEGVSHESGTLSLKGGSYHMSRHANPFDGMSVQVGSGTTLRDLLSEGYGFRRMEDDGSAGDWILDETALNGNKFAYAVKVEQLPEPQITQQPEDKTAWAGRQETLTVTAASEKELTYQWYLTDAEGSTGTAVDGATSATLTLQGQSAGTSQTYYCVITCDGYPFRSNAATVTWKKIMPVVSAEPKLSGIYGTKAKEFTISGGTVINPEDPAGSALEGTWSITDSNAEEYPVPGTTAEYELTFTPADSTFDSVTVKVTPQVEKKTIQAGVNANLERTYGQENPKLELNDVTVDWDQLVPGDTRVEFMASLTLETDATAASDVGDYRFKVVSGNEKYRISVNYKDAAGDYAEHGTLTVKRADAVLTGVDSVTKTYGDGSFRLDATANHTGSAIQYELTDGEGVVTVAEDGTVTILKAGTAKVRAYLPESQNYNAAEKTITIVADKKYLAASRTDKGFYFDCDHEGALDIRAILPQDCGRIQITGVTSHDKVLINKEDFDDTTGMLPYRILKNTADESAQIEITVELENYTNSNIVFHVTWRSKMDVYVREGQKVALKNSVMTYGGRISALEFEPVEFVDAEGNTLKGTLAWEDETMVPDCSVKRATWKFTPADDRYAVLTDFVKITVNQATPNVNSKPAPEKKGIIYDPAQTLADLSLSKGSLSWTVDGKEEMVSGSWSWVNPTGIPEAGINSYEARFQPEDNNYKSFTMMIDVTVAKAKPYLETIPTAAEITYGDSLGESGLNGGKAVYGDGKGNASSLTGGDAEVTGTFTWNTPDVKPAVSDSDTTEYEVIFTPTDIVNYETVTMQMKLTVNKAENAPDMPGDTMNVAFDCKKVSDVALDRENWVWQDSDLGTALSVGVETTATAVYTGADKGNYKNETVAVKITRSVCSHPQTIVENAAEATCTQAGYTGDICCTACSKVLTSGTAIPAKGHSYTLVITKQPTTAEEGIRTYTCGGCGHSYTEPIAKLSDGGSGSTDTGNTDTGSEDTGNTDTGNADTGSTDTGSKNTGSTGNDNPGMTDSNDTGTEDVGRNTMPFLKGENGKEGWDVIREEAKQAPAGEEITVDMNGTTEVPGSLFDLICGEDVTVVFAMDNGITWSVNGRDVTVEGVRDIDFGVKYGEQAEGNIPVSVINNVTGEKFHTGLSLAYDGEFGFQAVLTLNMDQKNAGLYASLYYYNEQTGEMEFICEEEIAEDGSVALTFTHASEYILVVDAKTAEQEPADTEAGNVQPADTGIVAAPAQEENHTAWWIFLIGAAAAAVGALAVILVNRKRR